MMAGILILSLYTVKTVSRNFTWKDDFTLFTTDVITSSNSTKCNVSAGGVLIDKARATTSPEEKAVLLQRAENYLNKSVEIYPSNFAGWVLLGNVYLERKDYAKAMDYYIQCLNVNNLQKEALMKLGFVGYKLSNKGDSKGSMIAFKVLSHYQPSERKYQIEIADAYSKTGVPDSAILVINQLLAADSLYPDGWSKLGEIYGRVYNRIDLAETYLTKSYKLDSKNISTLENLGIVNGMKKDFSNALLFLNKALALDTANPRILSNIASTYYMMGNKSQAEIYAKRAATATDEDKK
jgi:tetratricopeptide (TPR) repeat protein